MAGTPTIGILGGNGWMGSALGRNALASGLVAPENLIVSTSRREWAYNHWPAVTAESPEHLAHRSDILILSVRPEDFSRLSLNARGKLVISVMAKVSIDAIREKTGSTRIVRSMPNAAAEFQRSYTPWLASKEVDEPQKRWLQSFFRASGAEDEIHCEQDLDYLTALTGSGPAFPALIANILIEHATSRGLTEAQANKAVLTAMDGAIQVLQRGPDSPDQLVHRFLSYGGTTTEGLKTMQAHGLRTALHEGIEAAFHAASTASGKPA